MTVVTPGGFSRPVEELAPDPDVILVDGDALVGLLEALDGWDAVADYSDGVELRGDVYRAPTA